MNKSEKRITQYRIRIEAKTGRFSLDVSTSFLFSKSETNHRSVVVK
jgi:hypothetical protein